MVTASEGFFVEKIRRGLRGDSTLSVKEEALLLTPVEELATSGKFSPDQAQPLQKKCIAALTASYNEDTERNSKGAAIDWAEHNRHLYNNSRLAISGIVQNWYLQIGRSLEKQAVREASFWIVNAIILALIITAGFWLFT